MKFLFHYGVSIIVFITLSGCVQTRGFFAYYTKIDSGEKWERYSRTGKYTDVVVQLPQGQFVFHRSSSYLPYWQTKKGKWFVPEIIPRRGDGPPKRPDKNNLYSFVRIIESNSDNIIVHWRYFPDFSLGHHSLPVGGNVGFDGVVHEYFKIESNGSVTRVIRKGMPKLDDWNDPKNRTIQELILTSNGLTQVSQTSATLSNLPGKAVEGASVKQHVGESPALWWKFDEGLVSRDWENKDLTQESIGGFFSPIEGHKSVWKEGVSGTALGFDGYYSSVILPQTEVPDISGGFTLEAWIAPGAYSISSWTAITHQSVWEPVIEDPFFFDGRNWGAIQLDEKLTSGYFLGIDETGHIGFITKTGDQVNKLVSSRTANLYQWTHTTVTFGNGIMRIYINGSIDDSMKVSGELVPAMTDFYIGNNYDGIGYVSQHVVRPFSTFPDHLGFDGLIDEVKVYEKELFSFQILESFSAIKPSAFKAHMEPRILPGETGKAEKFGAYYTKLAYHDLWDNMWREAEHPDIVVKFDKMPTSVIFWRGNRNPGWVTENNKWICDQSSELTDWHWGKESDGCQSCCEHMSDYQARHSHVRLIENSDARVVVHWRYASVDVLYKHPNTCKNREDWGVWTDEYMTIYPDGVGVRKVDSHNARDYYSGRPLKVGFHDTQFLSQPGTKPEDNINLQALTIISPEGEIETLDWTEEHPSGRYRAEIIWINFKSDYKVFEIFPHGSTINVWAGDEKTSYSKFSAWNHYPVTQAPCDGRFAIAPDRVVHSALGAADNLVQTGSVLLYGFTNDKATSLRSLEKSWNNPPAIRKSKGCRNPIYDKSQRSYVLKATKKNLSFNLNGSVGSPIKNPCFLLKDWGSRTSQVELKINGEAQHMGPNFRQGTIMDTDGTPTKVIWIYFESNNPASFEIRAVEKELDDNV